MRFSQVLVSVVCSSLLVFSASISAAVADGHAKRGVACTSCHIEGQPSATNVTEQSCINCHTETPKGKPITMDGHKVPNVQPVISTPMNACSATRDTSRAFPPVPNAIRPSCPFLKTIEQRVNKLLFS